MSTFAHLHVHSEYSLANGIVRLGALAEKAAEYGMPAVALTDLANVHGIVKFYRACLANGVKPVVGCDVWVENPLAVEQVDRVIVLCRNNQGYHHLSKFLTDAYLRGQRKSKIVIAWRDLEALHDGLLVLFDDQEGPLANLQGQSPRPQSTPLIEKYQQLFGDRLYFQISRVGYPREQDYLLQTSQLAAKHGIGLVATNRVQFIAAEEFDAHEIRVCINDGRVLQDHRRPQRFTPQQYLRSATEMVELFANFPEAIDNSVEIAKRCNLFLNFDENFLPAYPDAGDESMEQILRRQAEAGLCKRLGIERLRDDDGNPLIDESYLARLELELGVITEMGFPGYFLIVADFIRWSKANDIPVGPGRGSGVGSLVAWSTGITELDPLHYGLLFERFLNPERGSLPDFDIDFCVEGRDRVIEYVAKRYGRDHVAQIITFGTMSAKAVVRDVGRVMGLPYGFVDQVAKLIPFELGMTLQKALDQEEMLSQRYREEDEIQELIDNAMQLEGIARNASKHAGGVVIAPRKLTEYTPLYSDTHLNQAITQLDKDDLEAIGLVKFDFLGLRTLTIIEMAVKMINQQNIDNHQPALSMDAIPHDDPATFELIRSGRTTAIFQLESRGIKELIVRLLPDKFDDMVALVALYRPGPLQSGMVDDYINRKHGRETVVYPHPDLEPILAPTYGVILYQEQVMQIAQVLAGYTFGGSDLLRAAMGKKKAAEMEKQREIFQKGAVERGVKLNVATNIFTLMEKFAGYGFNKSHSVAYALVAYHTAWLKTHHPAAYMAATLSAELSNTDKVVSLLAGCGELELKVLPPNINDCGHGFKAMDERTILYGMGAIKGVGKTVCESVEVEREQGGEFQDLFEFCTRLDGRTFNRRVLEALVKSGAMDAFGERAALMADIGNATQAAEQQQLSKDTGQSDMFGESVASSVRPASQRTEPWNLQQKLAAEKEALGLYLSGHPYTRYSAELAGVVQHDLSSLELKTPKRGAFAGLMMSIRAINTRRGKMAFVMLDNASERVEVILYAEKFKEYQAILQKGKVLIVHGEFGTDDFSGGVQMHADCVLDLDAFRANCLCRLHLNLYEEQYNSATMKDIKQLLSDHRGGRVEIIIHYYQRGGQNGTLKLGDDWTLHPTEILLDGLTDLVGADNLQFHYDTAALRSNKSVVRPYERARRAAVH